MSYWKYCAKGILKSELVKRGINTMELSVLLNKIGVNETKTSLDSKISRGKFSAVFMIQCLIAIGCTKVEIIDLKDLLDENQPNRPI